MFLFFLAIDDGSTTFSAVSTSQIHIFATFLRFRHVCTRRSCQVGDCRMRNVFVTLENHPNFSPRLRLELLRIKPQSLVRRKEGRKQDTKKFLAMAFAFLNSQLRCANTHLDMKRTIHTVTHGITCMQSEWDLLLNDNLRFELNSSL